MKTTHSLQFEERLWHRDPEWHDFRVGTVHGLYRPNGDALEILAVVNAEKHNGHFKDTIEWFEFACKRQNLRLRFLETWNLRLAYNLWKHGYKFKWCMIWELKLY